MLWTPSLPVLLLFSRASQYFPAVVSFDSITCINSWQSRLLHRATHVLCQWCNANWPVRIHHLHRPNWSGWLSDTYCNCSYFGFRECLEFTKSNATKNIIPPHFDVGTGHNYLD